MQERGIFSFNVFFILLINRAMVIQGQDEDGNDQALSVLDFVLHFVTFFWKVLFAFIPPR